MVEASGGKVAQVAREMRLHDSSVGNWCARPACNPAHLLRRLAACALGAACVGALPAAAATAAPIAFSGDTHDHAHPSILSSEAMKAYVVIPWQERY